MLLNSLICTGWDTWSKDSLVSVDNRCSIKLKKLNLNSKSESPTLELWESDTSRLGIITFDISDTNDQKIVVLSDIECKDGAKSCRKEFPFSLGTVKKSLECQITFAKSTWTQKDTTLVCDSTEISLTDDEGLLSAIHRAKYTKLNNIGSYNFHCPGRVSFSDKCLV